MDIGGRMNVPTQCAECGEMVLEGAPSEETNLFYCNNCWIAYETDAANSSQVRSSLHPL